MINYDSFKKLSIKIHSGVTNAEDEYKERLLKIEDTLLYGIKGEKLIFVKTKEIEKQLSLIEQIYQKITCDKKVKDTILIDSYHSATIEGARTTVASVKEAFKFPKTKDDKMVVNTVNGMNYALKNQMSPENISSLWNLVVKDVCENESVQGDKYRSGMVRIGSISETIHVPEVPEKIAERMDNLFDFMNHNQEHPVISSFLLHFYFVYIHPMCDGNGRTARILMSSYLYHHELEKITYLPISKSINENLAGYYASIKECEESIIIEGQRILDVTPFIVYMLNVFEECLLNSIASEQELNELEFKVISRMRKNGKGSEISVEKCAKLLKVTSTQANSVLNSLTEKGYVSCGSLDGKCLFKLI